MRLATLKYALDCAERFERKARGALDQLKANPNNTELRRKLESDLESARLSVEYATKCYVEASA